MKEYSREMVRAQLGRILKSPQFASGKKLGRFLNYVVVETLNGNRENLTQYTIGVEGLGYDKAFDPMTTPNVRVMARRLRRALDQYYRNHGTGAPVRIEIPIGGYHPIFTTNQDDSQDAESSHEPRSHLPASIEPKAALPDFPSIAVMQFEFLGNQSKHAFLADGVTEEIVIAMTRFPDFLVVGPLNRDIIHQMHLDMSDLGMKYNVRFLLDGKVRYRDQSLRILTRLTDTISGYQLWGQAFDYDIEKTSVDRIENDIVGRVVAKIADNFGVIPRKLAEEVSSHHDETLSDYEAVLKYHHYFRTPTEKSLTEAIEALETVVKRDHRNDLAVALLADLVVVPYLMGFSDDKATLERAESLARKAIALNPNSQQARYSMAQVHYLGFDKNQCLMEIEKVLELNPNNANYIAISAILLMGLGQRERSLALMRDAMGLNPHHPGWYHLVPFLFHFHNNEYENALFEANRFNADGYFWDPLVRAAALGQLGRQAEAKKTRRELLTLVADFEIRGRSLIQRVVFNEAYTEMLLDGLRKAGIEVS